MTVFLSEKEKKYLRFLIWDWYERGSEDKTVFDLATDQIIIDHRLPKAISRYDDENYYYLHYSLKKSFVEDRIRFYELKAVAEVELESRKLSEDNGRN